MEWVSFITSIISLMIASVAFIYTLHQNRLRIYAEAHQDVSRKYKWQVRLYLSNSGWRPISIVKISIGKKEEVSVKVLGSDRKELPLKLQPADVNIIEFDSDYKTQDTWIFVHDHKGKTHKVKLPGLPPFIEED